MLPHEWTYPEVIRVQRILNSGVLVYERESRYERTRDVLIAALMPGHVQAMPSAALVKACWFDFTMRLGLLLRQSRLHQSEFRWIEGNEFDHVRTCAFFLQDLPTFKTTVEAQAAVGKPYRHEFMTKLCWLPAYLDTHDHFVQLSHRGEKVNGELPDIDADEQFDRWEHAAWDSQRDHPQWSTQGPSFQHHRPHDTRLKIDEFAFVHVMAFLPVEKEQDALSNLTRLRLGLRLGSAPGRNISITRVPDQPGDPGWAFQAYRRTNSRLLPGQSPGISEREIAGHLERAWLDQLMKEFGCV
jgi:hypothetical protein